VNTPKPPRRSPALAGSGPPVIPGPRPPAPRSAPPDAFGPGPSAAAPSAPAGAAPPREVEASRKLIRPSLDARAARTAGPSLRRREAPPDATGTEAALLAKLASSGATVEIRLETGDVVSGQLEWADRSSIKLRRRDAPSLLIMKHAVVSLQAQAGAPRRG
jgi:sRNA-binding regulator protein Hfq